MTVTMYNSFGYDQGEDHHRDHARVKIPRRLTLPWSLIIGTMTKTITMIVTVHDIHDQGHDHDHGLGHWGEGLSPSHSGQGAFPSLFVWPILP